MVRYHGTLPPNLIGFLVDSMMFCHSLPPLLYHGCWRLGENTDLIWKNLTTALNSLDRRHASAKRIDRRMIKTMGPLRVKAGNLMIDPRMPYLLFRFPNNYQLKNLFLRAVLIILWSYYHHIFTELCNIVVCVGFLFIFTTRDILQKCR